MCMVCRRPVQPSAEHLASICQPEDVAECVMLVALLNPRARYTCHAVPCSFTTKKQSNIPGILVSSCAKILFVEVSGDLFCCVWVRSIPELVIKPTKQFYPA